MKIAGCKIVVTGASRGIGRATAEALARVGGRVALVARSPEVEAVAVAIVAQGGQARGYLADLGNPGEVEEMARRVVGDFGPPDIVVNNAGAGRWLYVEETPVEEVVSMMAAPYFAAFYVTRAFLPTMLERRSGYIVNINSPAAWMPWPGAAGYTAARFALRGLSASLRLDLRGTGVQLLDIGARQGLQQLFRAQPAYRGEIAGDHPACSDSRARTGRCAYRARDRAQSPQDRSAVHASPCTGDAGTRAASRGLDDVAHRRAPGEESMNIRREV